MSDNDKEIEMFVNGDRTALFNRIERDIKICKVLCVAFTALSMLHILIYQDFFISSFVFGVAVFILILLGMRSTELRILRIIDKMGKNDKT